MVLDVTQTSDNTEKSLAMTAFLYETSDNPDVKKFLAESYRKMYDQHKQNTVSDFKQ